MVKRRSNPFLLWVAANLALLVAMFVHASVRRQSDGAMLARKEQLVRRLELTDLCLFTDARYTRNPTMADFNTPFQDYPLSVDHFPSGSILGVPPHLKQPANGLPLSVGTGTAPGVSDATD